MNTNDSSNLPVPTAQDPGTFQVAIPDGEPVPHPLVQNAGPRGEYAWGEFFYGRIENPNTRRAYLQSVLRFLDWLHEQELELFAVQPGHLRQYLNTCYGEAAASTQKRQLSALRHFFDILVERHVVVLNPVLSVRGPRVQVIEGLTPEILNKQARQLLDAIDTSHVVGIRDKAVLATLIYTGARVGAVAGLKLSDLRHDGTQWLFRFREKGGKLREIPIRHDLEELLMDYIERAGLRPGDSAPLFRAAQGKTKTLKETRFRSGDMQRMMKRRLRDAELPGDYSPHSFRVLVITDLIAQDVPLEDVQHLAGHADARTTKLYDRSQRQVTRNIVERISV